MRKINILKSLVGITNVLTIICLILVLSLKTQFTYSLYWALIPLLIMFVITINDFNVLIFRIFISLLYF